MDTRRGLYDICVLWWHATHATWSGWRCGGTYEFDGGAEAPEVSLTTTKLPTTYYVRGTHSPMRGIHSHYDDADDLFEKQLTDVPIKALMSVRDDYGPKAGRYYATRVPSTNLGWGTSAPQVYLRRNLRASLAASPRG